MKFSIFTAEKNICLLHGHGFIMDERATKIFKVVNGNIHQGETKIEQTFQMFHIITRNRTGAFDDMGMQLSDMTR